jgi:hypothetical protein
MFQDTGQHNHPTTIITNFEFLSLLVKKKRERERKEKKRKEKNVTAQL